MTPAPQPQPGTIGWFDLTAPNADEVRDFYCDVAGWKWTGLPMGGYSDYCMNLPSGETIAGICHKRNVNASLPTQWLLYINVADLDASLRQVETKGGKILSSIRGNKVQGRFAVIQDPAGAVAALYEPGSEKKAEG